MKRLDGIAGYCLERVVGNESEKCQFGNLLGLGRGGRVLLKYFLFGLRVQRLEGKYWLVGESFLFDSLLVC